MLRKFAEKAMYYIDTRIALLKLTAIEQVALIMGFCMFLMLGMTGAITILIIIGMGLSRAFADLTGSPVAGYFITAGVYVGLMLLALVFKRRLLRLFAGMFVELLTDGVDDDDDEEGNSDQSQNV